MRVCEVSEKDQLWKGRSMAYGLGGPHVVYAQSIGDIGSTTSVNALMHGSTHTTYKLQQGFPFPTTAAAALPAAAPATEDAFSVRVPVWREELSGPGDIRDEHRRTARRCSRHASRYACRHASRPIAQGCWSQRPWWRRTMVPLRSMEQIRRRGRRLV
jgi:hypothetical protein